MAFPQVESYSSAEDASKTTSHVITFPAGLVADDLIVGCVVMGYDSTAVYNFGTGGNSPNINVIQYTYNVPNDWNVLAFIYARAIGGVGNDYITLTTPISLVARWQLYRISHHDVSVFVQSKMPNAQDDGGSPAYTTPACPTTPGSALDWLWLSFFGLHGGFTTVGVPTGFTDKIEDNITGDVDEQVALASARREYNTTQLPADAWTCSLTNKSWNMLMVGISPGALGTGGSSGGVGMYFPYRVVSIT